MELKNLVTISQIATILGTSTQTVRNAIFDKRIKPVYPFPNSLKGKDKTGPLFILCDDSLSKYLMSQSFKAQKNVNKKGYDPVVELKKYVTFIG